MNSGGLKCFIESHRTALVCLLLGAVTLAAYGQVWSFEFTNYDDDGLVVNNPVVVKGLTLHGLYWALTAFWLEYWHPVTWLSHMLDCQLFGLRAGWHHLVSLGFHVANTLLLFVVLRRMTGALWRSALVAALFALHPLHVESVAWIAERKDVLSGLFFMLTLWAYVRYAEQSVVSSQWSVASRQAPGRPATDDGQRTTDYGPRNTRLAILYYLLCLCFYGLGLMSKPMVMTLPFVLLLLDYWPLRRSAEWGMRSAESGKRQDKLWPTGWGQLLVEKLPFFALTAASCAITYQWALSGHLASATSERLGLRLANVPVSYARYLGKMIWPADLAVLYPMPSHWAWWQVGGAVVVLVLITLFAALRARSAPYWLVGWLIFVGVLFPTVRLVQSGQQSIADRYTYLPSIGLFMAVVWGGWDWLRGRRAARAIGWGVSGLILLGCAGRTRAQAQYWRNGETLFRHTIAVTQDNPVAYHNLGAFLGNHGRTEESLGWLQAVLRCRPGYEDAHFDLANAYAALKRTHEAIAEYQKAIAEYQTGRQPNPKLARAHYSLANQLLADGQAAAAMEHYQTALALKPDYAEAHYQLAVVLLARGEAAEASRHYREAIRLKPDWVEALNNLSWLLATQPEARFRDGQEAVALAARGVALTHTNDAKLLDTLGAALAEAGRFPEAADAARRAARLAQASGAGPLGREIEAHRQCYERGQPLREPSAPGAKSGDN